MLGEVEGRVEGHRDGHGFVVPDSGEAAIYLAPEEMRSVLHRDRVRVRVLRLDRKGRPEGRVLDIIERRKAPIIGRLLHEGGHYLVAPEDRRYGQDVLIPKNATANATVGQVVSVELTEPPSLHSQPVGRVAEVLGEIDDAGMEIEIAVRKYEVPHQFAPETLSAAAALPDKLRPADRKQRIDLTDVPLVTIDGEDARDFDDAAGDIAADRHLVLLDIGIVGADRLPAGQPDIQPDANQQHRHQQHQRDAPAAALRLGTNERLAIDFGVHRRTPARAVRP